MKLINLLQKLKTWFRIPPNFSTRLVGSFIILLLLALIVWLGGEYISWGTYAPYAQPEKRLYIILFLFLIWLCKFIFIDLTPHAQALHPQVKLKLKALKNRFNGAVQFLKKTTINHEEKSLQLNQLPWCLLIGPAHAGKTTLLAHAGINFILQRQFQNQNLQQLDASEHCDWWVTRDICLIDVPSRYLSSAQDLKTQKRIDYTMLWKSLLQLIRQRRGKYGLHSIMIALPLPELMKKNDANHYQALQQNLLRTILHVKKIFPYPIACQLIITKCDLLPGFNDFFAELASEELTQPWGITFPAQYNQQELADIFTERFDALIKKLNQQLLYRLHHERHPTARSHIKDFPLYIEQVKVNLFEFIRKINSLNTSLVIQNIFLTSAIQPVLEQANAIADNHQQQQLQIFQTPPATSQAYFIKQFIAQHRVYAAPHAQGLETDYPRWKKQLTYGLCLTMLLTTVIILGRDFRQGIKQTHAMQNILVEYQLNLQKQSRNAVVQLETTLTLLDTLQKAIKKTQFKFDLPHVLGFYSNKSQEKVDVIYYSALQSILLPEIKDYLEDYLKLPVNQDPVAVYAALTAYLMLGDNTHFNAAFIIDTIQNILPKSITKTDSERLLQHINLALNHVWKPLKLNPNTINETRKYLLSIPTSRLAYIILKTINNNVAIQEINLGDNHLARTVFQENTLNDVIPNMFTAKNFNGIYTDEINTAIHQSIQGNWILNKTNNIENSLFISKMTEQLRSTYISNYTLTWEKVLNNVRLLTPKNLSEIDTQIINIIGNDSPLLQLLKTLHENTYFEPITNASNKLRSVTNLLNKNNSTQSNLYQIFYSLQSLHFYLKQVLSAHDTRKAAFELISNRIKNLGAPDAIIQLRLIANKSPEPIKSWLDEITNNAWYFLVQEAGRYLDTSWQNQVMQIYQTQIANRYPFTANTNEEVDMHAFSQFFAANGVVQKFYNNYLQILIDTSSTEWRWKKIDNEKLPFTNESLRQIQQALLIQQVFFAKGDNKPALHFTIQPFKFGNQIKSVKINMDNKEMIDTGNHLAASHPLVWPYAQQAISIQLTMANQQISNHQFTGDWGWFRLVNQSFENVITHKQMLLNFSNSEQPAKYILYVQDKFNPFLTLNLNHFRLPNQLTERDA